MVLLAGVRAPPSAAECNFFLCVSTLSVFFLPAQTCQVCAGKKNVGRLVFVFTRSMHDVGGDNEDPENPESEAADAHYVWQYFTVTNNTAAKKGGSKNALCSFCEKSFSGCSTSRAAAHILARPVMGQDKAGIQPCVAVNKKDDDRRAALRKAQKGIGEVIRIKEQSIAGKKRKQQVINDLVTSPTKQSTDPPTKSGSNEMDARIASFFYENGIAFNVADSTSFVCMMDESMKFAKQNPLVNYKTPSRKKLGGELLDQAYTSTEQLVAPLLAVAKKYGATIASDGYSNVQRRPILNFMAAVGLELCL